MDVSFRSDSLSRSRAPGMRRPRIPKRAKLRFGIQPAADYINILSGWTDHSGNAPAEAAHRMGASNRHALAVDREQEPTSDSISAQIWDQKYRYKIDSKAVDKTLDDTWRRVAKGLADVETESERGFWQKAYHQAMAGREFLPAGRILRAAGTAEELTLMNTFVMDTIEDSVAGMMKVAQEAALTMQMGGGIGYDFSTLSPQGTRTNANGCRAIGPLAAMTLCDQVGTLTMSSGQRGAMMATLRCDHPDIEAFIRAKNESGRLRHFNLSVLVTDAFMKSVETDENWSLTWCGNVVKTLRARDLWENIMSQAYTSAEPGVLFIDRINARNPLDAIETIAATNSCAEQPLPPYGTAPLGSINLARLIEHPFEPHARLNLPRLRELIPVAVRMLDASIDASKYPLAEQRAEAISKRRIGLGVTGVADALMMLGLRYGSTAAARTLERWMREIHQTAVHSSIDLAREKGSFPALDTETYLSGAGAHLLSPNLRNAIRVDDIRNALVTSIAPTGSISLLAGNVSSGIEPIFALTYQRKIRQVDGSVTTEMVVNYAYQVYRRKFGPDQPLPEHAATAMQLTPEEHIRMQAAAQKWVDASISKTVNCPETIDFDAFQRIYRSAYDAGCKGCTTYRPNPITGCVLSV